MRELEKILEEINEASFPLELLGEGDTRFITVSLVEEIIRKHMNDGWIPVDKYGLPKERLIAQRKKPEPYPPKNEPLMLENGKLKVEGVKQIAEITICGVLHISVNESYEHTDFIVPTPEQRKNLKEMLCIDVKVFDEERSDNHDGE